MLQQAWRYRPGLLLPACAGLEVLQFVYTQTAGAALNAGQPADARVAWVLIDLLLLYRISRGGFISWGLLVAFNVLPLALILLGTAGWIGWYGSGLFALVLARTALLLSPAIRHHVRPAAVAAG